MLGWENEGRNGLLRVIPLVVVVVTLVAKAVECPLVFLQA